ncbi:hypothetical protein ADK67_14995 [Saccharothrix sp. NRRL B-16348]|uniref:hypothetical protein n=1 Tax=Saccharothrix sp. NRRL B-16348 TaxID=1415542 RepID=UPI0006AFD152|nr:hypothetical protein [Saccharothrix sp. NRRL B-16348]KOX27114.1 hypothetical protein ADK67_14995 [Saccharothrix sp. NRRL B-16348]
MTEDKSSIAKADETTTAGTDATHRARGEQFFQTAVEHLRSADDTPTDPTETTHIGWAQVSLLRAIYHELRHGNDLTEQNTTALKEHTAALDEHADGMDGLRKAMYFEGDAHSRK